MTSIAIPDFALVVLVGPTGSGKSSLARRHFLPTEIVSSDRCRAIVSDDETSQDATGDAFDRLHHWAGLRLKRRKLTVIETAVESALAAPELARSAVDAARLNRLFDELAFGGMLRQRCLSV